MRYSASGAVLTGPLDEAGVRNVWPKVEPLLSDVLHRDGDRLDTNDLLGQIATGDIGLYSIEDEATGELLGVVGCEINEYPKSSVFNIAHCAGHDLYRWAGLLGGLEAEAVRMGCDRVHISGRPGWGRVFPDYRETYRVFERKVVVLQ